MLRGVLQCSTVSQNCYRSSINALAFAPGREGVKIGDLFGFIDIRARRVVFSYSP